MKKVAILFLALAMVCAIGGMAYAYSGEYADVLLEAYYSNANSEFDDFYGGTGFIFPIKISPDVVLGNNDSYLSLPTGSFVTVGFTDKTVIDAPSQDDIFIEEIGASGDQAEIYVSSDNNDFIFLGIAVDGGITSFDLADIGFTEPVVSIKIIGIENKGDSPGFDLVNIKALVAEVVSDPTQKIDLLLNITAVDADGNKIDPASIAHEWLFIAPTIGGKNLGILLYTKDGLKDIETVNTNDPSLISATFDFDHTSETFSFGVFSLKNDLGMISGDVLMYGYAYALTDNSEVVIENVVTFNIQ